MSDYDSNTYYILPIDRITDDVIASARQTSRETVRRSIRPIEGKIHGLVSFSPNVQVPPEIEKYKKYSHAEILDAIKSNAWDFHEPIRILEEKYDYQELLKDLRAGRTIQCFGHLHITIFHILKHKFFMHHIAYLDNEEKWKVFKGQRFERSNEYSLLELNYFYNLISPQERDAIERFRKIGMTLPTASNTHTAPRNWKNAFQRLIP